MTIVSGLDKYGKNTMNKITIDIKLKEASKKFGKKFACGASVIDEVSIELQGDVPHDLMEYIQQEYPQVKQIIEKLRSIRFLRQIL